MIDIVGFLKIDESKPERIKALLASIRSHAPLKDLGSFVLLLDGPSEWLIELVRKELDACGFYFVLLKTDLNENLSYGWQYSDILLKHTTNEFILNFMEDHFLMIRNPEDVVSVLREMKTSQIDILKSTFYEVEQKSFREILKYKEELDEINPARGLEYSQHVHRGIYLNWFDNSEKSFEIYQKAYGIRYYIGVNFITTKQFALRFWNRELGKRPHEYEISVFDKQWEHRCAIPLMEFHAAIDDDHGEPGTCMLKRKCDYFWGIYNDISVTPAADTISLFHINNYEIKTEKLGNLLHGGIVRDFEHDFCEYVGAKYGCSFNSATSAIFLLFGELLNYGIAHVCIPSNIPPVVLNALIHAGMNIDLVDKPHWVGGAYEMHRNAQFSVIDSAQKVEREQYKQPGIRDNDLIIYSHYPTKPVGSCDGGMIVSNNKDLIERLRAMSLNGMTYAPNNWDRKQMYVGHKMYMNSIQAYIANENLQLLDDKKIKLKEIREIYNAELGCENTSEHLYRISAYSRDRFIKDMMKDGIVCGIHYQAAHLSEVFFPYAGKQKLILTEHDSNSTVSIPFHENLTTPQLKYIINCVKKNLSK